MKFLRVLLIIAVLLVAGVVILGLTGPEKLDVAGTTFIQASPQAVYEEVVDFKQWSAWSYWEKMDSTVVNTFSGADSGPGAIMSWTAKDGPGEMEILEAIEHEYLKMEMRVPDWEPSEVEWFFTEKDGGTEVKWTLVSKPMPFLGRVFMALMSGQDMIAEAYDGGLAAIAEIAEAKPEWQVPDIVVRDEMAPAMTILGLRMDSIAMETIQSGIIQGPAMGRLVAAVGGPHGIAGPPLCIAHRYDEENMEMDLEYAIPIHTAMDAPAGMIVTEMPERRVMVTDHVGAHEGLRDTWNKMSAWMNANAMEYSGAPYEVYVTDPGEEPDPSKWVTHIVCPVPQ